jgi:hypothetical protein
LTQDFSITLLAVFRTAGGVVTSITRILPGRLLGNHLSSAQLAVAGPNAAGLEECSCGIPASAKWGTLRVTRQVPFGIPTAVGGWRLAAGLSSRPDRIPPLAARAGGCGQLRGPDPPVWAELVGAPEKIAASPNRLPPGTDRGRSGAPRAIWRGGGSGRREYQGAESRGNPDGADRLPEGGHQR